MQQHRSVYHLHAFCFSILAVLFLYMPLSAQEEEKQLEEQRSYLFEIMSTSDNPEGKLRILRFLRQEMDSGKISQEDVGTINALARLAQQGTGYKTYDAKGNLLNNDLAVRAEACNFLGDLGGKLAENGLISTMNAEVEPYLAAVAMENLLKVNPDGNPILMEQMVRTFYLHHFAYHSENLAHSFLRVIAEYGANSNGKLLSPSILQTIYDISMPNSSYSSALRQDANTLVWNWIAGKYPTLEK